MIAYKKFLTTLSSVFLMLTNLKAQNYLISGYVFESDSVTALPFAYVVNKNSRMGVATDINGYFRLTASSNDTLIISYLGKLPEKIPLKNYILMRHDTTLKIYLRNKPEELKQVTIRSIDFSKQQRIQYEKYIYKPLNNTPFNSPISFIYDRFSKEAYSRKRLKTIYEQDLLDEMARKRLTNQLIVNLTGNPSMDFDRLKQICNMSNSFIITALEYDLYLQVRKCYQLFIQNK